MPTARYVVDAAVVAKWICPERGGAAARDLYQRWADGAIELVAPDLLVAELGSLLRRKVRAGELGSGDADTIFELLLGALPPLAASRDLAASALVLATCHDRPFADALHLALALREGCPYVTADERLVRVLAPAFPCLRYLEDLSGC